MQRSQSRKFRPLALVVLALAGVVALTTMSWMQNERSDIHASASLRKVGSTTSSSTPHSADVECVARGFGHAFTRTDLTTKVWYSAMSTWLTNAQAAEYKNVSVTDIPSGKLTKVNVEEPKGRHTTHGQLSYDTGLVLNIQLEYSNDRQIWLVASITPADAVASPSRTSTSMS